MVLESSFSEPEPDITMYQGTGKITSGCHFKRIPGITILEKNNYNYRYIGVWVIFFFVYNYYILSIASGLAWVYQVMDARGKFGEQKKKTVER